MENIISGCCDYWPVQSETRIASARFAYGRAGGLGSWCTAGGGRLPSRLLGVSDASACLQCHLAAAQFLTCPDEDVLYRARTPMTSQTRRPRGGPRCSARALLERAFPSVENRLYHDVCHPISWPSFLKLLIDTKAPPATDTTQSQDADVIWNSMLFWHFGEIRSQEAFLPPKVNQGPLDQLCQITIDSQSESIASGRSRAPSLSINLSLVTNNVNQVL